MSLTYICIVICAKLPNISDYAALIAQFERDEQFANRSRSKNIVLIDCKSVCSTAWFKVIFSKDFLEEFSRWEGSEVNSNLTVASFKRQGGDFRAFRPEDEVKHSNDPLKSPLKFDGGSFEPKNFFRKFFSSEV